AQSNILQAQELISWVDFAQDSLRSYLVSGVDADALQYKRARARVFGIVRKLEPTAQDAEQRANVAKLAESISSAFASLDEARQRRGTIGKYELYIKQEQVWREDELKIGAFVQAVKSDLARNSMLRSPDKAGDTAKAVDLWGGLIAFTLLLV